MHSAIDAGRVDALLPDQHCLHCVHFRQHVDLRRAGLFGGLIAYVRAVDGLGPSGVRAAGRLLVWRAHGVERVFGVRLSRIRRRELSSLAVVKIFHILGRLLA